MLFRSLLVTNSSTTLWADQYDARLLHWIAEWGYQVLLVRHDPLNFWNAPAFYPHSGTLAYSDSLLSAQLFYAPFRLLGVPPFTSMYLTLACVCIMGCALSAVALRRIGGFSKFETILIIFVSHFGLTLTSYLPHYQLFGFELAPPFFLFLYLYLRDWKMGDLVGVVFCFAYGVCFATYLAPMLLVLAVVVAIPQGWRVIKRDGLLGPAQRIGVRGAALVAGVTVCVFMIQLRPYLKAEKTLAQQSFNESAIYSARVTSFLLPARGGHSIWYGPAPGRARFGDAERAFFPGVMITSLSCCFLLVWLCAALNTRALRDASTFGADPCLRQYLGILFAASLVLALGPYLHGHLSLKLPFYFLSSVMPGLERVRAPGRFGIFVGLPAIYFAVLMLRILLQQHRSQVLSIACGILLMVDSLPQFKAFPYVNASESLYRRIAEILPAHAPVVELPIAGGDFLKTIVRVTNQLHGTLIHGGRIVLGYGTKESAEATELAYLDLRLQRGLAGPKDVLAFCKRLGISHLLLQLNFYPPHLRKAWMDFIRARSKLQIMYQEGEQILVKIMPKPQG